MKTKKATMKQIERCEKLIEGVNSKIWDLQDKKDDYEEKLADLRANCTEYQDEQRRLEKMYRKMIRDRIKKRRLCARARVKLN